MNLTTHAKQARPALEFTGYVQHGKKKGRKDVPFRSGGEMMIQCFVFDLPLFILCPFVKQHYCCN